MSGQISNGTVSDTGLDFFYCDTPGQAYSIA